MESKQKLKIYVLAGQSNMEGKASLELLNHQIQQPETASHFTDLHEDGVYIERDDVLIQYGKRYGSLTAGYGAHDKLFGPELTFGFEMGNHSEEKILLVKTCWGGKNLAVDFRPPSRPLDDVPENMKEKCGHFYREMIREVQTSCNAHKDKYDIEMCGVVWFQGWNDFCGPEWMVASYEQNLTAFVNDVRMEWGNIPFVIGVLGQHGTLQAERNMERVQNAQRAVGGAMEKCAVVETNVLVDKKAQALFPKWRANFNQWKLTGSDYKFHYYGSCIWFSRIGKAFAKAMLELENDEHFSRIKNDIVSGLQTIYIKTQSDRKDSYFVRALEEIITEIPSWPHLQETDF